jgi:hypothetical protein
MKIEKTKSQKSVENAVKIVKKAIKKKLSLSEASRQSDFGRNYVSDVKSRIKGVYKNRLVSKDTYNEFNSLMKEYSKN